MKTRYLLALLAFALAVTACSSPPTSGEPSATAARPADHSESAAPDSAANRNGGNLMGGN